MGHSPSSFFFLNCLLAGCRDPRWMLGPKIFSVYPPPLSSKPGNSFLDCSAGLHGIHVGVLLCRYLEFSFLPSDKVRHHTCPCFSSSQNTLALPALWPHLLFCPFHLFFCIFRIYILLFLDTFFFFNSHTGSILLLFHSLLLFQIMLNWLKAFLRK